MNTLERFLGRWKAEYVFKTYMSAACSLAATLFFAFYNGYLGIHHASLWYGTICIYYIMLTLLRGSIIASARMIDRSKAQEIARNKAFLAISFLLLILNISLIVPISIMVRQQKPVSMTLVPAITMAAYTTYKVSMASINFGKRKASQDVLVRLLRTISFIDALVSILTLQNTLIMVCSNGADQEMLLLTAVTSALVWASVLFMSLSVIIKGIGRIKANKDPNDRALS